MTSSETIIFLTPMAVMLAAAFLSARVARKLYCPAVFGELAGGIILGPTLFGALCPAMYSALFPARGAVAASQDAVVQLGMLAFLFIAGLEIDLGHLKTRGKSAFWTSVLGMAVPFGLGFFLVRSNPQFWSGHFHGSGWTPVCRADFYGACDIACERSRD